MLFLNLKGICGVISEKCRHRKSEFENERWKVRVEKFERHFDAVEKCLLLHSSEFIDSR